jgi:hypothetical protein
MQPDGGRRTLISAFKVLIAVLISLFRATIRHSWNLQKQSNSYEYIISDVNDLNFLFYYCIFTIY